MQKHALNDVAAVSSQDFPIVTTAMPINPRHRNIALAIVIVLSIVAATAVPFAGKSLARVDIFIPVIQAVMCVIDLITCAFLLGQYSIRPKLALLAIASGYAFSGLFAFAQTLAFPGAYSATGLIGDGVSTAAWLFVFWQSSFDLAIIAYVLTKDIDEPAKPLIGSSSTTIAVTIACILAVTCGLTWLAAGGAEYLPTLYMDLTRETTFASWLDAYLWVLSAAALLLLFIRRRTILDLWLMVVLAAWWPNFALPVFHTVVRFTLGWYAGRGFALIASSTLLVILLAESTALYAQLANAILLLRRERGDRLTSIEAATSAIAHEVRQPLTAIRLQGAAALRWLSRVPPGPELENVHRCLESVLSASSRAEEIIQGVRELFKPTLSRRTMLQLNDVIREVLDLVQHDLHVGAIWVVTEYANNLPEISADRTQMQQVILNLIKNAIEAMRGVSPNQRRLHVSTAFDGKSLIALYIKDTGAGISAEDGDRIFDPFFTTKPFGTGLGLSICRTILQNHGGTLRLAKSDSRGCSFEVALPIGAVEEDRIEAGSD